MKKILLIFLAFLFCPVPLLATDKIDINTASLQQLDELVGVGPAIAQRIIDGRPYASLGGLLNVKGIGEKTLQEIKNQGLAHVLAEPQAPLTQTAPIAPTAQPPTVPTPKPATYPEGIFINEILPAPEGADDTNEWIELYNQNDSSVSLQGWKAKDTKGAATTYLFSNGATIAGKGYLVLKRPQTKITLNNDEDGLSLIFPNGQTADSASYTAAVKNQSYNKMADGWKWSRTQTPGAPNTTGPVSAAGSSLLKQEKSGISNTSNKAVAAISNALPFGENLGAAGNPWFLFIVAILIAGISGAAILLFKLKFKKPNT